MQVGKIQGIKGWLIVSLLVGSLNGWSASQRFLSTKASALKTLSTSIPEFFPFKNPEPKQSMPAVALRSNLGLTSPAIFSPPLEPGFPKLAPNGDAYSLAIQLDGKILVGGNFYKFGSYSRGHIARLNPDGSLDQDFHPWANDRVMCFAIQADGSLPRRRFPETSR